MANIGPERKEKDPSKKLLARATQVLCLHEAESVVADGCSSAGQLEICEEVVDDRVRDNVSTPHQHISQ